MRWEDGTQHAVHVLTLRHACRCPACLHPSGQRLLDAASIRPDTRALQVSLDRDGWLQIVWDDEHVTRLSPTSARSLVAQPEITSPVLWDSTFAARFEPFQWADVRQSERGLLRVLEAVDRYGFGLVRGVPTTPGQILGVVDVFGYVRETNYGLLFDVRSVVRPANLAFTGLALGPHTDNPYRDPTPTLQLLHCLSSSVEGGDNTLVDGFRVAEALRDADPRAFDLLATQPVRFHYADGQADLRAETPIITLNVKGTVTAIRFNNRSMQATPLPLELIEPWYEAYATYARLLGSDDFQITVHLDPGDLLIMDNLRVVHGRTAFSSMGNRHLQGCYADRDGLRSRLAILRRRQDVIDDIFRRFRQRGDAAYLGEPVTQTQHMLQSAHAAERDGAPPPLVAAALLHDIGHLITDLPDDSADHGVDTQHEELGYEYLSRIFPPKVVEPIRLHVAAKRYLCAVDSDYEGALSPASLLSLALQGGPFTREEVEAFERNPYGREAARLRRYDDSAKDPAAETPPLEHYRSVLEAALL